MSSKSNYGAIDRAILDGWNLHAFRSGGGLRVVSLISEGEECGYGEAPHIEDALRLSCDDFEAGGRPYSEVYGKLVPLYLTGASDPSSALDRWLLGGQNIDAHRSTDWTPLGEREIEVVLRGYAMMKLPAGIEEMAKKEAVQWGIRGFRFESRPDTFPSGEPSIATRVLSWPGDSKRECAFQYPIVKRGVGATFEIAAAAALGAEPEEAREQ